jgi:hypothetical protein
MHGPHDGAGSADKRSSDEGIPSIDGRQAGQRVTPQQWAIEALARVAPPMPRVDL